MSEEIFWVVYEEEKKTRKWVDMPKEYIGSPLYEHATDYITILETGEKVMVRKKDGYVYKNGGVSGSDKSHLATPEEIEKMRAEALRKAKERRKRGLQGKALFVPTKHTDLRLPREDGSWEVSKRDVKGRWVPMPTNYLGKPVIEYWNCYITLLDSGEKVFVNKETGKITWGSDNPERDKGLRKRKEGTEKPLKAKHIPIEQIVKDRYDENVPWVVDLESSKRNRWYPMPINFKGKPTYESWDSYVTKLSDGSRIAISKRTNHQINEISSKKTKISDSPKEDLTGDKASKRVYKSASVGKKSGKPKDEKVSQKPNSNKGKSLSTGLKVISSKEELLECKLSL